MSLLVVVLVLSLLSTLVTTQGNTSIIIIIIITGLSFCTRSSDPVITPSGSVIVLHGNDLLVKCEASGNILSYQWLDSNGVIITTSNSNPLLLNITNVTQLDRLTTNQCKSCDTNFVRIMSH